MEKDSKDLKQGLLTNEEQKVAKTDVQPLKAAKKQKPEEGNTGSGWHEDSKNDKETKGVWYALKFTLPALWQGGFWVKMQVILTIFMIILAKVLNVIHPIILKYLIDTLVEGGSIYYLVGLYACAKFSADLINNLREVTFVKVSANAEVYIADKVYNHIQNQSLSFHLKRETGKIIRICSRGSQSFSSILRYTIFNIWPLFLELTFVVIVIAIYFPFWFFFLVLISIVAYITDTFVVTEWRAKYFKRMNQKDNNYVQKATDSLINFETVKYFNAELHEENRYMEALQEYKKENIKVTRSMVVLGLSQATIINIGLLLNLLLANYMIVTKQLIIGDFVMLNTFILQIYAPLNFLGTMWRSIRQSMVDVEQIFDLLSTDERINEKPNPENCFIKDGEIEFKNVSFNYENNKNGKMIIDNISFTVPAKKRVALVGSTGAGKSTIMRLLYRFYDIVEGKIFVDGQDISNLSISDLRAKIAIVPQDCVLFNDTMKYNIAYGGVKDEKFKKMIENPDQQDILLRELDKATKKAQIYDFIKTKELEYEEIVGERGLKLSGGEKQRVAIARALLK
jgi:ATP-binding cassette subfamily B protein